MTASHPTRSEGHADAIYREAAARVFRREAEEARRLAYDDSLDVGARAGSAIRYRVVSDIEAAIVDEALAIKRAMKRGEAA